MTSTRKTLLPLLGLTLLLTATVAHAAKPVGRLFEVQGDVSVTSNDGQKKPAKLYQTLYVDEKLHVGTVSSAVVSLRTGQSERVLADKSVTLTEAGIEPKSAVISLESPKKTKQLIQVTMAGLAGGEGGSTVTRGQDAVRVPRLSPIVGSTVTSLTPAFRWPEATGATAYEVVLYRTGATRRAWDVEVTTTSVTYAGKAKLSDGAEYRWEVYGKIETVTKLLYEGKFVVATADTRELAKELSETATSDEAPFVAFVALRLEELGLWQEAIPQYERLLKLAPQQAAFPAALSDLYARSGQASQALQARDKAKQLGFEFEPANAAAPKK